MGQVNVNTPGGGSTEPSGSSGAGFILGIILALIVVAALVYFLVIAGPSDNTDNGGTNGSDVEPPSSLVITYRA